MWLDKCLKSPLSEDPWTSKKVNEQNTIEIWTAEPLTYLMTPGTTSRVEKVSVGNIQNVRTIC